MLQAWASWALDHGVKRAHVVNPADGALLEELFTSKNGVNTCLYHDDEIVEQEDEMVHELEDFFQSTNAALKDASRTTLPNSTGKAFA